MVGVRYGDERMRRNLTGKGRAFLVVGTLCLSTGAVWFTVGAHSPLAHAACGLLFGFGVTLNIASWVVGRRSA